MRDSVTESWLVPIRHGQRRFLILFGFESVLGRFDMQRGLRLCARNHPSCRWCGARAQTRQPPLTRRSGMIWSKMPARFNALCAPVIGGQD